MLNSHTFLRRKMQFGEGLARTISVRENFSKCVVSLDGFSMSCDGIKHRNVRVFLLAEKWD